MPDGTVDVIPSPITSDSWAVPGKNRGNILLAAGISAAVTACLLAIVFTTPDNQAAQDEAAIKQALVCMQQSFLKDTGKFVTIDQVYGIGYKQVQFNLETLQKIGDRNAARKTFLAIHCGRL
jgi:hypothetical protein